MKTRIEEKEEEEKKMEKNSTKEQIWKEVTCKYEKIKADEIYLFLILLLLLVTINFIKVESVSTL